MCTDFAYVLLVSLTVPGLELTHMGEQAREKRDWKLGPDTWRSMSLSFLFVRTHTDNRGKRSPSVGTALGSRAEGGHWGRAGSTPGMEPTEPSS